MEKKKVKAKVISQREIADGIYDMWIETDLAADVKAGQFICVYPCDKSTLLPRPISVCEADRETGRVRMVYRIAGKGTKEFSRYRAGDGIEILGNLGNGFPLDAAEGKRVFLMGGGIGIPPMLQLAKDLKMEGKAAVLESEIKMDEALGGDAKGKKEELTKVEQMAAKATASQMETLGDANEAIEEAAKAEGDADKGSDTKTDAAVNGSTKKDNKKTDNAIKENKKTDVSAPADM